jgi:hypothetical protein
MKCKSFCMKETRGSTSEKTPCLGCVSDPQVNPKNKFRLRVLPAKMMSRKKTQ